MEGGGAWKISGAGARCGGGGGGMMSWKISLLFHRVEYSTLIGRIFWTPWCVGDGAAADTLHEGGHMQCHP